ncbi:MAG: DUF305 domain-containing protein [Mycobacterium sp.]
MNKTRTVATGVAALAAVAVIGACSNSATKEATSSAAPTSTQTSASAQAAAHNQADMDFAHMMIPHHQQAIEMSDIILAKKGIDPRVVDLATQIKAAQGPEIEKMQGWMSQWGMPMSNMPGMPGMNGSGTPTTTTMPMPSGSMMPSGSTMPGMGGMSGMPGMGQSGMNGSGTPTTTTMPMPGGSMMPNGSMMPSGSMMPGMGGMGDMGGMSGMDGMMSPADMDALKNAQGVEASKLFLTGMVKHHQGALTMAKDEVKNGQFPDAVAMAKSILESQQKEIDTMNQILGSL